MDFARSFAPVFEESVPLEHRLFWAHELDSRIEGVKIQLVGLNTAILARSGDHQKLQVGQEQLTSILGGRPSPQHVVIALSHHPPSWLNSDDRGRLSGALSEHADFHLYGHVHDPDLAVARRGSKSGELVSIVAGAVHSEEHTPGDSPVGHGYSVASILIEDGGKLALHVWPRAWLANDSARHFRPHPELTGKHDPRLWRTLLPEIGERVHLASPAAPATPEASPAATDDQSSTTTTTVVFKLEVPAVLFSDEAADRFLDAVRAATGVTLQRIAWTEGSVEVQAEATIEKGEGLLARLKEPNSQLSTVVALWRVVRVHSRQPVGGWTWSAPSPGSRLRTPASTHSSFVGRAELSSEIRQVLADEQPAIIQISGPAGIGKSRLVEEVLGDAEHVDWHVSGQVEIDHLAARLEQGAIVVLDPCPEQLSGAIAAGCLYAGKLIFTTRLPITATISLTTFRLGPLERDAARDLTKQMWPKIGHAERSWLTDLCGGWPGLIVDACETLVRPDLRDIQSLVCELLPVLQNTLLAGLSPLCERAAGIVAALSHTGAYGFEHVELEEVVGAFRGSFAEVSGALSELQARGLLVQQGRFVSLQPPLLANALALDLFERVPSGFEALLATKRPGLAIRTLERLVFLEGSQNLQDMAWRVFGHESYLSSWTLISRSTQLFKMVAQLLPEAAFHYLREHLEGPQAEQLSSFQADSALTWSCRYGALDQSSFANAAACLFWLSCGQSRHDQHAADSFAELFLAFHPEVSTPLAERLDLLENLEEQTKEPQQRALLLEATLNTAKTQASVMLIGGRTARRPDSKWWPKTYGELFDCLRRAIGLSGELYEPGLIENGDRRLDSFGTDLVHHGLVDEGLSFLEERVNSARGRHPRSNEIRNVLEFLGERTSDTPEVHGRVRALLEQLEEVTFLERLRRWTGEVSFRIGSAQREERIQGLAKEACSDPGLLDDGALSWLSDNAARGGAFMFSAGRVDAAFSLWSQLRRLLGEPRGLLAGVYVAGASHTNAEASMPFLEEVKASGDLAALVEALVGGSWSEPWVVEWLAELHESGAAVVERLWTLQRLGPVAFLNLVRRLCGDTPEAGADLIDVTTAYWRRLKGSGNEVPEATLKDWREFLVALGVLAAPAVGGSRRTGVEYNWGGIVNLCAENGDWETVIQLLELYFGASERPVFGPSRFLGDLLDKDRPRVLGWMFERIDRFSYLLRDLIDPSVDREFVLTTAREGTPELRRRLAGTINAGKSGFWALAVDLLNEHDEEGVTRGLSRSLGNTGVVSGGFAPLYRRRAAEAEAMLKESEGTLKARAAHWLRQEASSFRRRARAEDGRHQETRITLALGRLVRRPTEAFDKTLREIMAARTNPSG